MKGLMLISLILCFSFVSLRTVGQCSICTRTVQQMGEGPAKGLNAGIIYLAFTPLAIGGIIGFRWWRSVKHEAEENKA